MYKEDDDREGMTFLSYFLPHDDARWPHSYWLIEQELAWKFFRRLLPHVRFPNPDTGEIDVRLSELVDLDSPRFPESDENRRAHIVQDDFFEQGQKLERCLCDALAMLSPVDYRELVQLQAEDIFDISVHLKFADWAEGLKGDPFWHFHYLNICAEASRILGEWESQLHRLRAGEHLAIWRYYSSMGGARQGGLKSGKARAQNARLTPEAAANAFDALRKQGRPERSIAAIVALRHAVTPDHVRRVIKLAKKPT